MNFNLYIERLVLDGLPVAEARSAAIQAAVEAELSRLFFEQRLPCFSSGSVKKISGGEIQLAAENNSARLGQQIAGAVHRSLASPQSTRKSGGRGR